MEMKYVVPDMAQSFGTLEFAGESEPELKKVTRELIRCGLAEEYNYPVIQQMDIEQGR